MRGIFDLIYQKSIVNSYYIPGASHLVLDYSGLPGLFSTFQSAMETEP
jgi:hypothetical protein